MNLKLEISDGSTSPLGFCISNKTANFALFSQHASRVILGLFLPDKDLPVEEIEMKRTGNIWHICIENLPANHHYAFRCEGPRDDSKGYLFSPNQWLADPYGKILDTPIRWGVKKGTYFSKAAPIPPFDWQGVGPPHIPPEEQIIYEMHVRGFTQDPSSQVKARGTYLGVIEKIPYLKKLGINVVELMPIYEFDESHCKNVHPKTGKSLTNYWGYNPLFYFAPMRRFSVSEDPLGPITEFKTMVRELHRNGIKIILDVVYNHTGEGKEKDYEVNFRGLDNTTYYMVDPSGRYKDFSGCGNTLNCNHPAVHQLIIDSLSYWAEEMHVDGFRFDLASIFTRDQNGSVIGNSPVIQSISSLKGVKLIAESWDAAGLYQVGQFPHWGPWSEWNGHFRDIVRRFLKGTNGYAGKFADVISGSQSTYGATQTPLSSINFITAHDGFCLRDLVTYQHKYNTDNGEQNRDGANQNDNWNCGFEGPIEDSVIEQLRDRQMRNFFLALLLSQGTPMLLMGDEYGHTRKGNNNPYVQDNELNWFLWNELAKTQNVFSFVASLIEFRKQHALFRRSQFLTDKDVEWHGFEPKKADWSHTSRFVAFTLRDSSPFYLAFNANFQRANLKLPPEYRWREVVNTTKNWNDHSLAEPSKGRMMEPDVLMEPYSAILCCAERS